MDAFPIFTLDATSSVIYNLYGAKPLSVRTPFEVTDRAEKNNVRGLALDVKFRHFWLRFLVYKK